MPHPSPAIALVSREYPPFYGGGIGTYAAAVVPALAAAGATVHVITAASPGRPAIEAAGRVTVHRVPMGDGSPVGVLRGSIAAARVLARLWRRREIDLAEFADYEAAALATTLLRAGFLDGAQSASLPVVVHLHTPTQALAALQSDTDPAQQRRATFLAALEKAAIDHADAIGAPSRFIADWAAATFHLDRAPEVIPYALSPGLAAPTPAAPESRRILYTGRLERRKGVRTLAAAWARVAPAAPGWTLRLVGADTGTGPAGTSMAAELRTLLGPALASTVFTGNLPPEAVAQERLDAEVCVIPSLWENFPNTCIEAMAAARPVIVSDAGGMREMLSHPSPGGANPADAGMVFRAGDVESLAHSLRTLTDLSPRARHDMGQTARERILACCDPAAVAARRLAWYRRVIDAPRAPARPSAAADLWRALNAGGTDAPPPPPMPMPILAAEDRSVSGLPREAPAAVCGHAEEPALCASPW